MDIIALEDPVVNDFSDGNPQKDLPFLPGFCIMKKYEGIGWQTTGIVDSLGGEEETAMYDIVIKNGMIVTAQGTIVGDLAIIGEKIAQIDSVIDTPASVTLDAEGKYVLPGLIDSHTHFSAPDTGPAPVDDFTSGSQAALFGGVTTILEQPDPPSESCSLAQQLHRLQAQAENCCYVDYSFHPVFSGSDLDQTIAQGVTSLQVELAAEGSQGEAFLAQEFLDMQKAGGLTLVRAEDRQSRHILYRLYGERQMLSPYAYALAQPNTAEAQATARVLAAAAAADEAPVYLVNLSCREALAEVRAARARGQRRIFVDTCPQYLLLDSRLYLDGSSGANYVMDPPLRSPADTQALWEGLAGGAIQTLSSDHRAYTQAQKFAPGPAGTWDFRCCPPGIPGVEQRLDLLYQYGVLAGRLSIERLVAVCSTNPARIFGLYPAKGLLAPGSDADIVLYDGEQQHTLDQTRSHGRGDWCPYQGRRIKGGVDAVLLRGKLVVEKGRLLADSPAGRFFRRDQGFQDLDTLL